MSNNFTYLHQAIENSDTNFIATYLTNDDFSDISTLTVSQKVALIKLLNVQDIQSLKLAKTLLDPSLIYDENYRKAVDKMCRGLGRRTADFKKLVYLKGKIDFMKDRLVEKKNVVCENVVNE